MTIIINNFGWILSDFRKGSYFLVEERICDKRYIGKDPTVVIRRKHSQLLTGFVPKMTERFQFVPKKALHNITKVFVPSR